jgi:uncharacterized paraquat-inducible protein A
MNKEIAFAKRVRNTVTCGGCGNTFIMPPNDHRQFDTCPHCNILLEILHPY